MLHQLDRATWGRIDLDPPARAAFETMSIERWRACVPEGFAIAEEPSLEWFVGHPSWPGSEALLRISGQVHAA